MLYLGINIASCKKDADKEPLTADFSVDTENVKVGESVVFSDLSTGKVSRWNWTFEGAESDTSTLSSPTVTYNQPGKYAVTLQVSNAFGTSTETKKDFITVGYNAVHAAFKADTTTIIQGDEITFTDQSTGLIENWSWEFTTASGTKLTANKQHPLVKFEEIGVYTVKLSVSNPEYSDVTTRENYITVLDPASLSIDFSADETGTYEGGSVTFTPSSVGSVDTWQWEFEGGTPATSNAEHPTVNYAKAGRYRVKLSGTNSAVTKDLVKEGYIMVMPGDKLVAYFPFGGSLHDAGPHQFIPEVKGTVTSVGVDRNNHEADASVFNGSGGLIIADHDALNFGTSDYSVSCWIKTNQTNRMMIWQESGDKGSADNQTWLRLGANTTTQLIGFATEDANGGSFMGLSEAEGGKIYDNIWHHVVCIRQGLKTMVYVDGVKRKEIASTSGVKAVSNTEPFKIGMQGGTGGYSNYFNGMLDDLVIYNKALSETEVLNLLNL